MSDEPSEQFRRSRIHEVLVREGKLRMKLIIEIGRYADMSEGLLAEEALREQLGVIEETIGLLVEAARDAGQLVGRAT